MGKDYTDLMNEIKDEYEKEVSKNETLLNKAKKGLATYDDANEYAIKCGKALSQTFNKYVNTSLEFDEAMQVIFNPMKYNYHKVKNYCKDVQISLNGQANINIKPIVPEMNTDRIFGIVDGYVNSLDHEKAKQQYLGEPVINYTQSIVDDFVRTNAEFSSKLGMHPKIVRTVTGNCCEWCANLAGTYDYADVSNTGNDVFRRHKNCRCTITYVPISGKSKNAWSKKLLSDEEDVKSRKELSNVTVLSNCKSIKKEWLKEYDNQNAKYDEAKQWIDEEGTKYTVDGKKVVQDHTQREIDIANIISKQFGTNVIVVPRVNAPEKVSTPDYLIKNRKFDLKEIRGTGKNVIDGAIKDKKKQANNFVIDITNTKMSIKEVYEKIDRVYRHPNRRWVDDIILVKGDNIVDVLKRK